MEKITKEHHPDGADREAVSGPEPKAEPAVKDRRAREGGASPKRNGPEEGPRVQVRDKRFWVKEEETAERTSEPVDLERKPTYVTQLEKKIEEGDRKLKEYIAAYKQKMAETEEIRARLEKNMEEQADQRFARLAGRLLPIIDNFSLALQAAEKTNDFLSLRDGVKLIHRQLLDELTQTGVQPVRCLNQPFDPNLHEAVQVQPVKTKEQNNLVVQEIQTGYVYKEKLLRPAKVVVGKFTPSS